MPFNILNSCTTTVRQLEKAHAAASAAAKTAAEKIAETTAAAASAAAERDGAKSALRREQKIKARGGVHQSEEEEEG